ncbi:hypothetical protein ACVWYN_002405 [Pedobacter sp. UYP24]
MKNFTHPVIKISSFLLLISVSFFACKKNENNVIPPVAVPIVTNVQPKNPMPGDIVTITGTNFGTIATDVKVSIGTKVITISSVTNTEIKFALPTGITAGDIAVAIKNILATNTDPQKATITPGIPTATSATIISINPTSGKAGDVVSILGTGFSTIATDNVVKFNGTTATVTGSVTSVLTVTVPTGVTTGAVTVSVKGAAVITGPIFTVNASTVSGTGTAVPYVTLLSGTATFSKIATAPSEIGAMTIDKKNNVLYYSDYSVFSSAHPGTIYKLKLDGSDPVVLTTDVRITKVGSLATDVAGNIYAVAAIDNSGIQSNFYKIDASTSAVTVLASNINTGGSGGGINIDSQGGVWIGTAKKLNTTTNTFDQVANSPVYVGSVKYQGDDLYSNNRDFQTQNPTFYKFNLLTQVAAITDFTLQGLFKQDNAKIGNSALDFQFSYTLDGSENFYAIYPQDGDAANSLMHYYYIRKTKNGNGGTSTLITKFYIKPFSVASPVFYKEPTANLGIMFHADAGGNLYLKANGTDIIKITP